MTSSQPSGQRFGAKGLGDSQRLAHAVGGAGEAQGSVIGHVALRPGHGRRLPLPGQLQPVRPVDPVVHAGQGSRLMQPTGELTGERGMVLAGLLVAGPQVGRVGSGLSRQPGALCLDGCNRGEPLVFIGVNCLLPGEGQGRRGFVVAATNEPARGQAC